MTKNNANSWETLQEIRSIMERSGRFLSLSGWSGIWAGTVAIIAAMIANNMLRHGSLHGDYIVLGGITFLVALAGAWLFTAQKAKREGVKLWNKASQQLALQLAIPMAAGGAFVFAFLHYGIESLVAPACLCFYGLALINGSKYTLADIRYLGYLELVLAGINLCYPRYGIYLLATGFGVLHILYGIIMWNKYDR